MLGSVRIAKTSFSPHVQQPWGFMLAHSAVFVLYCKKQQGCLIQFCCCNLSPRGDGNRTSRLVVYQRPRCNLSPRGDGNLGDAERGRLVLASCNLSPRGDGNLRSKPLYAFMLLRCNLSPRGDGNQTVSGFMLRDTLLQLIPARGRKPVSIPSRSNKIFGCNLSPRGDGNLIVKLCLRNRRRCNLSPRGDGNSYFLRTS